MEVFPAQHVPVLLRPHRTELHWPRTNSYDRSGLERINSTGSFVFRGPFPREHEFCLTQCSPLHHEPALAWRQASIQYAPISNGYLGFVLCVFCVEVRWRVVAEVHLDDYSEETA